MTQFNDSFILSFALLLTIFFLIALVIWCFFRIKTITESSHNTALCYLPCSLTKDPALAVFLSMMRPYLRTRMAFNISAHYANLRRGKGGQRLVAPDLSVRF